MVAPPSATVAVLPFGAAFFAAVLRGFVGALLVFVVSAIPKGPLSGVWSATYWLSPSRIRNFVVNLGSKGNENLYCRNIARFAATAGIVAGVQRSPLQRRSH